jgi:hypothetical protein
MPTYNRLGFVREAVRCFLRQDYPNLELVIVDDGTDPVEPLLPNDARLRLIRLNDFPHTAERRRHPLQPYLPKTESDSLCLRWRKGSMDFLTPRRKRFSLSVLSTKLHCSQSLKGGHTLFPSYLSPIFLPSRFLCRFISFNCNSIANNYVRGQTCETWYV